MKYTVVNIGSFHIALTQPIAVITREIKHKHIKKESTFLLPLITSLRPPRWPAARNNSASISQIYAPQPLIGLDSGSIFPRARCPPNKFRSWDSYRRSHARTCTGHSAARGFIQTLSHLPSLSVSEDAEPHGLFGTSVDFSQMQPLQYWLKPRVPLHAWHHGCLRVKVIQAWVP